MKPVTQYLTRFATAAVVVAPADRLYRIHLNIPGTTAAPAATAGVSARRQ
jgi:hypothetical protein